MLSHWKNQSECIFVRSKRTGDTSIRRADEFTPHPRTSLPQQFRPLHYIGADRTCLCRCNNPSRHFEKTYSIASESKNLYASLTLYMDSHHIDSCTISDFHKYCERRKAQRAKDSIRVDAFHYVTSSKDVVCRRTAYRHGYSTRRNPEIIEQCTEYFCLRKNKLMVCKQQWQGIDGDSPPAFESRVQHVSAGPANSPVSQSDAFHYDSKATQEFVHDRSKHQDWSPVLPEMEMRNSAAPVCRTPYRTVLVEPRQRNPEVPPQVWQNARPSVCVPGYKTTSALSTPMGSAFPQTPAAPLAVPTKIPERHRPSPLSLWQPSLRSSTATYWSDIQRQASVSDEEASPETLRPSAFDMTSVQQDIDNIGELPGSDPKASMAEAMIGVSELYGLVANSLAVFEKDGGEPSRSSPISGLSGRMSVPFVLDECYEAPNGTPIAELPTHRYAEPLAQPVRQRDTTTLKGLEGRDWDTASELEARVQRPSVRVVRVEKPATRRMSTSTSKSVRLSSLFEQVLVIAGSSIPDQEEFCLRHDILSSRTNSAPAGNRELCSEPYQHGRMRTVMLPDFGHFLQEQCLLDDLRARDQQFGSRPNLPTDIV